MTQNKVIRFYAAYLLWCALAIALTACVVNPIRAAETAEQKAYAAYGTFVIFEEQAAQLVQSPEVPADVKQALREADAIAKPAADTLLVSARVVASVRRQVAQGTTTNEKLQAAIDTLNTVYMQAIPKIAAFVDMVDKEQP